MWQNICLPIKHTSCFLEVRQTSHSYISCMINFHHTMISMYGEIQPVNMVTSYCLIHGSQAMFQIKEGAPDRNDATTSLNFSCMPIIVRYNNVWSNYVRKYYKDLNCRYECISLKHNAVYIIKTLFTLEKSLSFLFGFYAKNVSLQLLVSDKLVYFFDNGHSQLHVESQRLF